MCKTKLGSQTVTIDASKFELTRKVLVVACEMKMGSCRRTGFKQVALRSLLKGQHIRLNLNSVLLYVGQVQAFLSASAVFSRDSRGKIGEPSRIDEPAKLKRPLGLEITVCR